MTTTSLHTILDLVRQGEARTRAELSDWSGLSRKVVAQRLEELQRAGLVGLGAFGPSTGGRAPRELHFAAGAANVLVADFNARRIAVGVCDLAGTLLDWHEEPAAVVEHAGPSIARVEELLDEILASRHPHSPPVWGLGIGALGPVDAKTGRLFALPIMTGWRDYPLRDHFTARYRIPVWVDNGVNLMAFGEFRDGIAQDVTDLIFMELGDGIGAGLISDGRLSRGALGYAGEVGHLLATEDPSVTCWCGNKGCLVQLAGGLAIARAADAAADLDNSSVLARGRGCQAHLLASDVTTAAAQGDPVSIELIAGAGRLIGKVAATLITACNPALLVIGGVLSGAGDVLLAGIRESIYRYALPMSTRELRIEVSPSSDHAVLVGAGFTVIDALLSAPVLDQWIAHGSPAGMLEQQRQVHARP